MTVRRILIALALLAGLISPILAAAPAQALSCVHHSNETYDNYTISAAFGTVITYRWGLVIEWNHCVYDGGGYYDDKTSLKVYGRITDGSPYCWDGSVVGGFTEYRANVGAWGTFNPGEVTWPCTSSTSWSYTWVFNPQPRLWNGAGDRCVGASWTMPRWGPYTDKTGNIPAVCF
jgi:hypothetical protein